MYQNRVARTALEKASRILSILPEGAEWSLFMTETEEPTLNVLVTDKSREMMRFALSLSRPYESGKYYETFKLSGLLVSLVQKELYID